MTSGHILVLPSLDSKAMRHIARAFLLLLLPTAVARTQAPAKTVSIGTSDSIWSATLKENRRYLVYTPPSYSDTTYLPRRYPVLYLLDGDAHFHSVTGLMQILGTGVNGTFVVPEMIVVAIPNTNRTRDMTPTKVDRDANGKPQPALAASGGMANFLGFIKSELIPRIEQTYRTAPYRVFVGHSFGGITTINALYTMPETFNAYVAIDPSLWWDNRVLLKQARDRFSQAGTRGPRAVRRAGEYDHAGRHDAQRPLQLDRAVQQHPRDVQYVRAALCVQVLSERQPRLRADDRRVRRAAVHLRRVQRAARNGDRAARVSRGPFRARVRGTGLQDRPARADGGHGGPHRARSRHDGGAQARSR